MGARGRHEGQRRLCGTRKWSCRRLVRAVGLGLRGTDPGREGAGPSLRPNPSSSHLRVPCRGMAKFLKQFKERGSVGKSSPVAVPRPGWLGWELPRGAGKAAVLARCWSPPCPRFPPSLSQRWGDCRWEIPCWAWVMCWGGSMGWEPISSCRGSASCSIEPAPSCGSGWRPWSGSGCC